MNFDASRMLSFDLETTSANPREARVVISALVRIDGSVVDAGATVNSAAVSDGVLVVAVDRADVVDETRCGPGLLGAADLLGGALLEVA